LINYKEKNNMATTVKYTKRDLVKAKKVLENALGYIERYGFNINTAIESERLVEKDVLKLVKEGKISKIDAKHYGTVCFIGATRIGAGVQPRDYVKGTDYGDGKELTIALELLDKAVEIVDPENLSLAKDNNIRTNQSIYFVGNGPGGVAEALGFIFIDKGDLDSEDVAENMFKAALTYIHDELDRRK
jgi:hypothetical protein